MEIGTIDLREHQLPEGKATEDDNIPYLCYTYSG
jgi:hypothetical protein